MKKYFVRCPMTAALSVVGGKWKPLILWYLHIKGSVRYGELKKQLPDASLKVYNEQLKELESDKLISKQIFAEVPPRTEYSLTDYGKTLVPMLQGLMEWGYVHLMANPQITDSETFEKIKAFFANHKTPKTS